MKMIKLLMLSLLFSNATYATSIDDLIAKTSIALGDEYVKEAQKLEDDVIKIVKKDNVNFEERLTLDYPIIQEYENFRNLALLEYRNVLCTSFCQEGTGNLNISSDYVFYRREAHSKSEVLYNGSLASGVLIKTATIYAANGEFEEHLLGRLYKLVATQQSFDTTARNLNKQLLDLQSAYVNQAGEVIGVDQALLRDSNYQLSQQTQYQGYKSCVDSYNSQDQFETAEYRKSLDQYELLRNNLINNLSKIYDFTYNNPAGDKAFRVPANLDWMNTNVSFEPNDKVSLITSGKWSAKAAASVFKEADLVRYTSSKIKPKGFFKKVVKVFASVASMGSLTLIEALRSAQAKQVEAKVLEEVRENANNIIAKIKSTPFDSGPEGYYYTFSNSVTKGINNGQSAGTSASGGYAGFFSIGVNESTSSGDSTSNSASTGGTYGLKLYTTLIPEVPVGALVGAFCDHNPSTGGCPFFEISAGGVFNVEAAISESATLWVRVNDKAGPLTANTGSINLEVKKATAFKNYLDQYYEWMDQECDSNGENCGLNNILENIAYTPNPTEVVNSIFIKKFPDFPAEVRTILLNELNYIVQMNIIQRDLKSKEHSQELNDVKVTYCKEQVRLTEESVKNTSELIRTYSNMTENSLSKRLLLDTAKQFYEKELENLNWIRGKNLERIDRYYNLAINSFNYLYFSDYQPVGSLLDYYEGDYYQENIERMKDQIIDITTVNDLLNPNRGFVVYELSKDELAPLQSSNSRNRKTQFKPTLEDVMCSGFGLDGQTRVMIEKVGVLLDLDPAREHLFFSNPHVKNTKPLLAHGSENRFYDLSGKETEYWMPAQKRAINAWSTQVLTDTNSDYQELRDSRYFDRLSFRKTSFASTWNLDLTDPTLRMFTQGDSNPVLRGVKLVYWFNSTESQGELPVNACASSPINIIEKSYDENSKKVRISWELDKAEVALFNISDFTIYQAGDKSMGYRIKEQEKLSSCIDLGMMYRCEKEIDLSASSIGEVVNFKIRSAYKKDGLQKIYPGYYSEPLAIAVR